MCYGFERSAKSMSSETGWTGSVVSGHCGNAVVDGGVNMSQE